MNTTKALILRQAALQHHLPSESPEIEAAIEQAKVELAFIDRFTNTKGWSRFHPAFIVQVMSCLRSLETKASLTKTRGDGRLATILDVTRTNGNGVARAMGSIEKFNDLTPAEREVGPAGVTYPLVNLLPYSSRVLGRLDWRIAARREARPHKRRFTESERASLLLDSTMTDHAVIGNTIEYLARAFARQVDPEVRHELISGDGRTSLKAAFDTLQFAPA